MNRQKPWIPYALIFVGVWILVNTLDGCTDDSDKSGWDRSGLRIYTDHKTGVQYVGNTFGGLHPRIYSDRAIVTVGDDNEADD